MHTNNIFDNIGAFGQHGSRGCYNRTGERIYKSYRPIKPKRFAMFVDGKLHSGWNPEFVTPADLALKRFWLIKSRRDFRNFVGCDYVDY